MEIKIHTNISKEFTETSIIINAPKLTDELNNFINKISELNEYPNQIIASKDNDIYFIKLDEIIAFFSEEKSNYIRTEKGNYKIKYKLYEIEETLNPKKLLGFPILV